MHPLFQRLFNATNVKNKLIRDYDVTDASVHDSNVFHEILNDENTNKDVWADSAYRSKESDEKLKRSGFRNKVQRKGARNKPLTEQEKKGNKTRSKVRSRVEHVFGSQTDLRRKMVRCIGMMRTRTEVGMMNLVYNMRRFCFLQRG